MTASCAHIKCALTALAIAIRLIYVEVCTATTLDSTNPPGGATLRTDANAKIITAESFSPISLNSNCRYELREWQNLY